MMAMTSGVERVEGGVSDGAACGLTMLLSGLLVSGLGVKIRVVVKIVEGCVTVWVRVRIPDWVEGMEGRAAREDGGIASLEEMEEARLVKVVEVEKEEEEEEEEEEGQADVDVVDAVVVVVVGQSHGSCWMMEISRVSARGT